MCIFVVVKDVGNAKFSDREDEPVGGLAFGKLIDAGIHFLRLAAEIDRLPDESPLAGAHRDSLSDLVGFAAGESGNAERVVEPKSLIDLRIDPQLGALPQPHADIERGVPGLAALTAAGQAVGSLIGRAEGRIALFEERGLAVKVEGVRIRRGRRLVTSAACAGERVVAELIVQAGAQFVQREVGIDPLRRRRKTSCRCCRNR